MKNFSLLLYTSYLNNVAMEVAVIRSCNKEEIWQKPKSSTRRVHLCVRPSVEILTAAPEVREISCPPSRCRETSPGIRRALERLGVRLKVRTLPMGRPPVHAAWKLKKIHELRRGGYSTSRISREPGIPLRTVQYYLKRVGHCIDFGCA